MGPVRPVRRIVRFAVFSCEGTSLSWQKRLLDEKHDVLVYHAPSKTRGIVTPSRLRDVGLGIVPLESAFARWRTWGHGGIFLFDGSGFGGVAETLRAAGELVIGAGAFCDKLEGDRDWGTGIAESVGIESPETTKFATITDAVAFLKKQKPEAKFYFKTDKYISASETWSEEAQYLGEYLSRHVMRQHGNRVPCVLQASLPGFALSTARWWNGRSFVGPIEGTVEHKKHHNDDKGGATGCAFNLLWFYRDDETLIARALAWDKLAETWRKENAPPGIYDINALLSEDDEKPYFLEWTPRMGYDSEPTAQRGISDLGGFLEALARGGDTDTFFNRKHVYGSVRLSVSPYPFEGTDDLDRDKLIGLPLYGLDGLWSKTFTAYGVSMSGGQFALADPNGLVGLASATGTSAALFDECYEFIDDELHIKDLQYRTDAKTCVQEDLKTISSLGYDTR